MAKSPLEKSSRSVPRPFSLHWGNGQIVEEATYTGRYHEPTIQLLEFDDRSLEIRFCYYDHLGRFQRSPLILGKDDLAGLRKALVHTPRLRSMLSQLVSSRVSAE